MYHCSILLVLIYLFADEPFQVKLSDGTSQNSGRLEVRFKNIWGTVCNEGFDIHDADVACRMLGYVGAENVMTGKPGDGITWLSNVECDGSEESIEKCDHSGWGQAMCSHDQDVVIDCRKGISLKCVTIAR